MRVVFLTGIWPPDVGGPATHGPDFAAFLRDRGHEIQVVTMGDEKPTERPVPVTSVARGRPFVVRYPLVALTALRFAHRADIVYATATYAAAAAASVRTPLVAKLVSDPAYERARRYGLFDGSLDEFQEAGGAAVAALKRLRTAALRQARVIVVPSRYLAGLAAGWRLGGAHIEVLVNPAPSPRTVVPEPLDRSTFVFVGRLTEQKGLAVLFAALQGVPAARLLLVGDGPERAALVRLAETLGIAGRVTFAGPLRRDDVLRYLAGARAAVLPSLWENLPHSAVESLSVGTPVVASAVGGVPEIVHDDENGLLVAPGDSAALAAALRQLLQDDALHARLAAAAQPSVGPLARDAVYGRLEKLLAAAAR
jgi:glycosyltransferase involved in cell wall biosynthesis